MPVTASKRNRPTAKRTSKPEQPTEAKKAWPLKESREDWLRHLRTEYTQKVCAQTLALHESLPVDGEP